MFLKILLLLACFTLTLEASTGKQCGENQKYKKFVTCEKTCKDLKKKCNLSSRCACEKQFYKDEITGTCVESADKCTLKYAYEVLRKATKTANKALTQVPGPIQSEVKGLIATYKVAKFLNGSPTVI